MADQPELPPEPDWPAVLADMRAQAGLSDEALAEAARRGVGDQKMIDALTIKNAVRSADQVTLGHRAKIRQVGVTIGASSTDSS
jgi:hypothetical protein